MKKKWIKILLSLSIVLGGVNISYASHTVHIAKEGESFFKISQAYKVNFFKLLSYNGADQDTKLVIGQRVKVPKSAYSSKNAYVTYLYHTVQKGDDPWQLSLQYGIPMNEILKVNNMNENEWLKVGDQIKIPVHHVPIKATISHSYGEYLDWWTEAQYVLPIGSIYEMKDVKSKKSWMMKRTIGANHADCEPLGSKDAAIMKSVWGGVYSWDRRPVIVIYKGRKIAASAAAMPHDIEYIKNNDFNGHMDVHFLNSTRHKDGKIDEKHQENVKIAAGIK